MYNVSTNRVLRDTMKLLEYIDKNHKGNAAEFARDNNYHITQVRRCLNHDGYIDKDNKPYFKKYLNKAK